MAGVCPCPSTPLLQASNSMPSSSPTEILLHSVEGFGGVGNVTANTTPGFTRNSAPLWARGQDAFLVIQGSRVQAQPATQE